MVQQGRTLAIVAMTLMPALIAVVGMDRGYPLAIVGGALLIWVLGTLGWVAVSWRLLKP
jgi:hypothetical protein